MGKVFKIVILTLLMILGLFILTGCDTSVAYEQDRFSLLKCEGNYKIVYDKYTKVEYVVSSSTYNYGNFTILVNADGTPYLYNGDE